MKGPLSFFIFLISFFIFLLSCKRTTEPTFPVRSLQLTVQDVSCTETWLGLKVNTNYYGKTLKLYRNDSLIVNKPLTAADSVLYVDSLQPATSYAFAAKVLNGGKLLANSAKVKATTLDTTSHDFTWQTWEFGGQGGSSAFYDVAIIDENDIWAVGEIYTEKDKYNAAHWDGEKWELKKITYGGWFWTINTVYAFSPDDVWFEAYVKWNGSRFNEYPVPDILTGYGLNKIWGKSDSDLYVVGNGGLIAHYDGQEWARIESGTDLPIQDIWGARNKSSEKYEILCIASDEYNNKGKRIIQIKNKKTHFIDDSGLPWSLRSIWFISGKIYYVCGDGIYSKHYFSKQWGKYKNRVNIYKNRIRGLAVNDIVASGAFGLISHYNGIRWHHYVNDELPLVDGNYYSIDYKVNMLIAVGEISRKAAIIIGIKN